MARPRWTALVGAAAALALIVGLGAWNLTLRTTAPPSTLADQRAQVLALMEDPATQRVPLVSTEPGTDAGRGAVVLHDGHAWLVVDGLAPNDRASSTYVLWGAHSSGGVTGVAPFDVVGHTTEVIDVGPGERHLGDPGRVRRHPGVGPRHPVQALAAARLGQPAAGLSGGAEHPRHLCRVTLPPRRAGS